MALIDVNISFVVSPCSEIQQFLKHAYPQLNCKWWMPIGNRYVNLQNMSPLIGWFFFIEMS
jgi:hypothetical protein